MKNVNNVLFDSSNVTERSITSIMCVKYLKKKYGFDLHKELEVMSLIGSYFSAILSYLKLITIKLKFY